MRQKVVLVTGANGEIGHGLIKHLHQQSDANIVALDVVPLDKELRNLVSTYIVGDVLDQMLLGRLVVEHEIATIYHLASILSTKAEYNPETAHRINVEGTLNLLRLAVEQSQWQGESVMFVYPSSIAAYGIPTLRDKANAGAVIEEVWNYPSTMYGCNKLYCEHLGRYYNSYYRQLAADHEVKQTVDFRAIRFPGLISAETVPTGGTSDYGPEMLHAAAKGEEYSCFVRPDTIIPFMVMPDAIKSLVSLAAVSKNRLSKYVYNVTSFSITAQQIFDIVKTAFPAAKIHFAVDEKRQKIVDTWPEKVDDSAARRDWDWKPDYDCDRSFREYLIPAIRDRYQNKQN
jgi:nucleoside-diphosphate-sugar epimerase